MRTRFFVGAALGLIIGFSISLGALERKKPPLREFLTNKADPMYTPIPYPKTDQEVLADLRYWLKKTECPRRIVELYKEDGQLKEHRIVRKAPRLIEAFVKGGRKGKIVQSQVIRVQSRWHVRSGEYTFLIVLKDRETGKVFRWEMLDDAGRYLRGKEHSFQKGKEYEMEGYSIVPAPFSAFADDRVREILERYNIRVTSQTAEELFHAVDFAYGASWPLMLMHKTKDGTILVVTEGKTCVNCPEYRVYMAEILPCPKGLSEEELLAVWRKTAAEKSLEKPGTLTVLDSVDELFFILRELS